MVRKDLSESSHVLVVDDDKQINVAVCRVLDRAGYVTSGAQSAEEALGLMEREKFDLVIADIVMDGMDGMGLLEEIKKRDKALPVVLVTGFSNEEYEERAHREGAYAYVRKPLSRDELVTVAVEALADSRDKLVPEKGVGFS